MHELPVTQNILALALTHAEKAGATRIASLHITIGDLASIIDDSIMFYWDIIAKDTIAEGAQLHFRRIQTELRCLDCDQRYYPDKDSLACPKCAGMRVEVVAGREFYLDSIDIEK